MNPRPQDAAAAAVAHEHGPAAVALALTAAYHEGVRDGIGQTVQAGALALELGASVVRAIATPDRYRGLVVVGTGPSFTRGRASRVAAEALGPLDVGAPVDVLLDDGRIVRSTLRARVSRTAELAFIEGIVGGYHVGRVRPRGGFAGVSRCAYLPAFTPGSEAP